MVQFEASDLKNILTKALSRGGDFAEVYYEYTVGNVISFSERKVKSINRGITEGIGIRVINGDRTGYAYSDDRSLSKLLEAADVAAYVAEGPGSINVADLTKRTVSPLQTIAIPAVDVEASKKIELLIRADDTARTFDKRIKEVNCGYGDSRKVVMLANSEGEWVENEEQLFRLSISVLALEDDKRDSGIEFLGGRYGFEYFEQHTPERAAKKAAEQALMKLHARPAPAGRFPVLIEAGWGGVIVHEAVGHGLEGDGIRKQTSLYSTKIGQKVAAKGVTIIDDGTVPNARGSLPIDDEGTPMQRTTLIENGVLTGFLYDRLNAKLMKTQSTGNGRRESFRHIPLPRMRNTFIDSGKENPRALLRSVKKGIYAKSLGGGQVDTVNGSFVFEINEGYLIENGEVTYPIRGANLMGNGVDVMKNVVGVGNNLEIEKRTGSCGKDGQYVPVGVGQPTILVSEITVGGTDV